MEKTLSSKADQDLLIALQRGIPLVRRPWAVMAQALNMSEAEVLHAAQDLFTRGVARRFGAVFDSSHLGYASTLCAVDVPGLDIERVAELLKPHPGVTHCYEREGVPNLWFTVTAPADKLGDELRRVDDTLKPYPLLNLPAIRRFKVEVVLDAAEGDVEPVDSAEKPATDGEAAVPPIEKSKEVGNSWEGPRPRGPSFRDKSADSPMGDRFPPAAAVADAQPRFTSREKALIREIQGNLSVIEEPFLIPAQKLRWDQDELLERLASWKQAGILRRIGFILRHRAAGFVANGMCVWPVAEGDVERAGRTLAQAPEVTHCYERPSSPTVPFNLYAMIHARDKATAENTFHRLGKQAALNGGRMLVSTREFKKSSPVFFLEADETAEKA